MSHLSKVTQQEVRKSVTVFLRCVRDTLRELQPGHYEAMMEWLHDLEDIDAALTGYIARERSRVLTSDEAEHLLGRELSQIEKATEFTIDDLEKRMSESYEAPVCLLP